MHAIQTASDTVVTPAANRAVRRRSFLKFAGASILVGATTTLMNRSLFAQSVGGGVNLSSGDIAVLNFAYALEQLEAAFYAKVTNSFYSGAGSNERQILGEIREHEAAHSSFLKKALGSAAIPQLEFNFGTISFSNRQSVLTTARTFEDTGVAAYNGAGQLLSDPGHLLAAGRIVSVEARHAAVLRDMLQPRSTAFAGDDVVDVFGLGSVSSPTEVFKAVAPYIRTPINAATLPNKK